VSRVGYVGREAELAELRRVVDNAVSGEGGLALVVGEAGMGKTAFVGEASTYAVGRGVSLFRATCWDGDGAPTFWPWVQILRGYEDVHGPLSKDVSRIMPELAVASGVDLSGQPLPASRDGSAERFALFDDVSSLLVRAARAQPLMLVLDDLQWADVSSVLLLEFLASQLRQAPLLVVGMYRDDETLDEQHRDLLARLRRQAHLVPLAGLPEVDVSSLMGLVAGSNPAGELAAGVSRRTGGNPFFVREVTQLLVSRGNLADAGSGSGIPEGVRAAVEQRLARLPQACVWMLRVAATAGREVGVDLLVRTSGYPADAVADAVEQAVRARVLVTPPTLAGPYRFTHDLFREALYEGLNPGTRSRLHGQLGHALAELGTGPSGAHPAELAHHFLLAAIGPPADLNLAATAVHHSLAATAEAVQRFAYEDAVGHSSRTLDALGLAGLLDDRSHRDLLLSRAEAHRLAGETAAARQDYRAASGLARRTADAEGFARAALGVHALGVESGGSRAACIELLEEALDSSADEDSSLKAQVLAALARELFLARAEDRVRAATLSRAAVEIARRVGDYRTLAGSLLAAHDTIWLPGSAHRRRAIAVEMGAAASRAGDLAFEAEACLLRASAGLELGDPAALRDLDEFFALAQTLGQPHYTYLALTRRIMRATLTGHLAEAESLMAEAAALAESIGEPDTWNVQTRLLWELRTAQGQRALAESRLRTCSSPALIPWFDALVGLALLERGETAEATRLIMPAVQAQREDAMPYVIATQWAELSEGAAAVGLTSACQRYYDALRPYAGTTVVVAAAVGFAGAVDHHLGVLAAALGRQDDAVRHLDQAAVIHERLTAWPWLARTRLELASVLAARGRSADRERVNDLLTLVGQATLELTMPGVAARLAALKMPPENVFVRTGDSWHLTYEGRDIELRDAKGLADIASLLRAEGQDIPATVLAGQHAAGLASLGADPVLDRRAQQEYRSRLAVLDRELDQADLDHDPARSAAITDERAVLVRELSSAVGLGHRDRALGDDRERARKAVTARIKDALHRVESEHPALGAHLRGSITTGHLCSYRPEAPVHWRC
jgi:predicted ATPase